MIIIRLWHENLLPYLPRQQLLGQHRECAALRGNGWGKPHNVIDYIYKYSRQKLYRYHYKVMKEMFRRGYNIDPLWWDVNYRGKNCEPDNVKNIYLYRGIVYEEHNDSYLNECLENLRQKGIILYG